MAKIFITGYMGSGKSTAGKKLASELGYEFIDLDHFIETEYKQTIPEIFASKGEKEFRSMENNTLKKVLEKKKDAVVACGGGTPCYFNNMELMNNNGITIYLKMSVDALVSRLLQAKEKRNRTGITRFHCPPTGETRRSISPGSIYHQRQKPRCG
jgi:shikimate kinase